MSVTLFLPARARCHECGAEQMFSVEVEVNEKGTVKAPAWISEPTGWERGLCPACVLKRNTQIAEVEVQRRSEAEARALEADRARQRALNLAAEHAAQRVASTTQESRDRVAQYFKKQYPSLNGDSFFMNEALVLHGPPLPCGQPFTCDGTCRCTAALAELA